MNQAPEVSYARRLGVWDATMVVVGGVIGSGIFLTPATIARQTGSGTEQLLAWGFGGVLALIGALCYAELGARRPNAGGGYVNLREAFGLIIAFVYGWNMLVVNYSGSLAAVATIFVQYAAAALGVTLASADAPPYAIATILLLTFVNWFGIRAGAVTQNILTVLKLAAIASLIAIGLVARGAPPPTVPPPPLNPLAFGGVLLPVLFAYGGWAYINNIAGEIREPQRNLPRALVFGMLLVATCYLLANLAYLLVLGHEGLAASKAPAADLMRRVLGEPGARVIALGIAISTLGFCNISLIGAARVFQAMGADGVFFRIAGRLHPKWRTPNVALMMLAGWACVLALDGHVRPAPALFDDRRLAGLRGRRRDAVLVSPLRHRRHDGVPRAAVPAVADRVPRRGAVGGRRHDQKLAAGRRHGRTDHARGPAGVFHLAARARSSRTAMKASSRLSPSAARGRGDESRRSLARMRQFAR